MGEGEEGMTIAGHGAGASLRSDTRRPMGIANGSDPVDLRGTEPRLVAVLTVAGGYFISPIASTLR